MRDARYRAKFVAEMHDRMPVVLEAKDFEQERLAT
jgi:putative SOS response-associated peptidase YedK